MTNATNVPSIQKLAADAIDVQNACNLSGVVNGFSRALAALRELPEARGNDWLHAHPIAILWADKIASLTGTQDLGNARVMKAYDEVYKLRDSAAQAEPVQARPRTQRSTNGIDKD
jgi:hypothetical protein